MVIAWNARKFSFTLVIKPPSTFFDNLSVPDPYMLLIELWQLDGALILFPSLVPLLFNVILEMIELHLLLLQPLILLDKLDFQTFIFFNELCHLVH
jgi:hypothetical protein